jgi:hypothetical protein
MPADHMLVSGEPSREGGEDVKTSGIPQPPNPISGTNLEPSFCVRKEINELDAGNRFGCQQQAN